MQIVHVFPFEGVLYSAPLQGSVLQYSKPATLEDVGAPGFDAFWRLRAVSAYRRAQDREEVVIVLSKRVAGRQTAQRIEALVTAHLGAPDLVVCRPMTGLAGEDWCVAELDAALRRTGKALSGASRVVWYGGESAALAQAERDVALRGAGFSSLAV